MATACRIGGMVSDVSADTLDALTQFGHHLGMCFQVVDDVLDVTGTEAELGKPAGNDVHEGVYTLPVIYALRVVDGAARRCSAASSNGPRSSRSSSWSRCPTSSRRRWPSARTHAAKATEALAGATELDADVCDRLRTLVDGLVLPLVVERVADRGTRAVFDAARRRVARGRPRRVHGLLARRHAHQLPAGVIDGVDAYRKLVGATFAWADAGVVRRAPPRGRRTTTSCWPTGRSAPAGARTASSSSGAACRSASSATTGSPGGASITSRRPASGRLTLATVRQLSVDHRVVDVDVLGPIDRADERDIVGRQRPDVASSAQAVSCSASGASRAAFVASTSSRNRSTASLNAFGASAMRPCAAPRST